MKTNASSNLSPNAFGHTIDARGRGCYDPAIADQKCRRIRKREKNILDNICKESISYPYLDDVPRIFTCVTELAAGHACAQAVVADTDGFVFESIGEVILPFRHGSDEDTDALV